VSAVTIQPEGAELAARRRQLLELWVDVTEAGGAVGFRPGVGPAEVAPVVDRLLHDLAEGWTRALVARGTDGEVVGLVTIVRGLAPRMAHRVTLRRLLVDPDRQGEGLGRRLTEAAHALAVREFGADLSIVEVRDGLGLDRFYERLGYTEVGRIPDGLQFEDGDRVDELFMARRLP
jgi:predicted N-acetyltransferase YhbS